MLVNSSTAWSPPGWCISKRDPPGDPWCRTVNFPNQQSLHKGRGAPSSSPSLAGEHTAYIYTRPSQVLSLVFSVRISSIRFPFLAHFKAPGHDVCFPDSRLMPSLNILPLIKKNEQGNQQKIARRVYLIIIKVQRVQNCGCCITNIANYTWWPNICILLWNFKVQRTCF